MKKIVKLLSYILLISCLVSNLYAETIDDSENDYISSMLVEDNIVSNTDNSECTVDLDGYYAFIYSNAENRQWANDNVIGTGDYKVGYLYAKNGNTNVVKQLINMPISIFRESKDDRGVYFIYNNGIYWVNYEGNEIINLYNSSSTIAENILERFDDEKLFFIENNCLTSLDIETRNTELLRRNCIIDSLYAHDDHQFAYSTIDKTMYYFNSNTGENREIDDTEFFEIFDFVVDEDISTQLLPTVTQNDPNFARIYNMYPNGSYFTTTGTACVNHNHCKTYCGAIQCVGFAKYAYNVYANQTSWDTIPTERFDDDKTFDVESNDDIMNYFSNCAPLTIVYVCREGEYEYHAITVVSLNDTNIRVYDCNWTKDCKVRLVNMTYEAYRKMSPSSSYFSTHKYSNNYEYNNAQTHIQHCDNSGCDGYRLEYHYNPTYMNVCMACNAYVSNIQYTEPLATHLKQ